ncbi:MAG: RHS repeat-associated core domain-containing protein [Opitutales bacterium]
MARCYVARGFIEDSNIFFYTKDHLGSTREVVANDGVTVESRYDYDPWGETTKIGGTGAESDFLYTGHFYHAGSGLYLAKYRAYDAELGRWLSRDPLGFIDGPNVYAYVGNNPINVYEVHGLKGSNPGEIVHNRTGTYYKVMSSRRASSSNGRRQYSPPRCESAGTARTRDVLDALAANPVPSHARRIIPRKSYGISKFSISAHHNGSEIWGVSSEKGTESSISSQELIDALHPSRFTNNPKINLDICFGKRIADEVSQNFKDAGKPVTITYTSGENRNIPYTPIDYPGGGSTQKIGN